MYIRILTLIKAQHWSINDMHSRKMFGFNITPDVIAVYI